MLTLAPAATDTMFVCTSAAAVTLFAASFLLLIISELNLLATVLTARAAPAETALPPFASTATLTMVLPAAAPCLSFVSWLR